MDAKKYIVIGAEESPYSVKVRSYFRYKNIPHEWATRSEQGDLYQKLARLPLIPLVVTPDGAGMQDSTPIIERMEPTFNNPSIHPDDSTAKFVSILLEEFGDEWGNKWMFHLRWAREVDQIGCARRIALMSNPQADETQLSRMTDSVRARMVDRVWFVGSNEITAPQIEQSFVDALYRLNAHLATRPYLFGERPAFADFGLWGQIYNANRDTTPAQMIAKTDHIQPWLDRMLDPSPLGEFESWESLAPTLIPLLRDQVGSIFLPWSDANSNAIESAREEFSVELASGTWTQKPQKYHARSLRELRNKFAQYEKTNELVDVLSDTQCLKFLENG